jgi:hypothetical protein
MYPLAVSSLCCEAGKKYRLRRGAMAKHLCEGAVVRADRRANHYDPPQAWPVSSSPAGGWGEIDAAFLEEARPAVPAFPLDLPPATLSPGNPGNLGNLAGR